MMLNLNDPEFDYFDVKDALKFGFEKTMLKTTGDLITHSFYYKYDYEDEYEAWLDDDLKGLRLCELKVERNEDCPFDGTNFYNFNSLIGLGYIDIVDEETGEVIKHDYSQSSDYSVDRVISRIDSRWKKAIVWVKGIL